MGEVIVGNKAELTRLENIIQKNLTAFYEVGNALKEIRDSRLYRDVLGFETFEEYCRERWDISRIHAHRLIGSASVYDNLLPMGNIAINERQARPLTKLDSPEQQQKAWQKVIETAPDGKITARHVSKVVSEIKNETIIKKIKENTDKAKVVNKENMIDEEVQKTFDAFYYDIQTAKMEKWQHTSKEASLYLEGSSLGAPGLTQKSRLRFDMQERNLDVPRLTQIEL